MLSPLPVGRLAGFAAISVLSAADVHANRVTIANFNFNNPPITNTTATAGTGTISFAGFGEGIADNSGTLLNALPGDTAGRDLTLTVGTGGNNSHIDFQFSTLLRESIVLSFARQRSSTGFTSNAFSFSTDASSFTPVTTQTSITTSFSTASVDFSSFSAINNQANVTLRLIFAGGTNTAGNNRFDNVRFEGAVIPTPTAALGGLAMLGTVLIRRRRGIA